MAVEQLRWDSLPFVINWTRWKQTASAISRTSVPRIDRYDAAMLGVGIALFVVALWTVLSAPGLLGADVANYLVTMRRVFGDDPTGVGLQRPPLIAVPLKIATTIFPVIVATKLLAVLAWLSPGLPAYKLMRRVMGGTTVGNIVAIVATTAFLTSATYAAMTVWGWITFLGIALMVTIAWLIVRSERRTWKDALLIALVLGALAATHQVSLMIALAWMAIYGTLLIAKRDWQQVIFMLKAGGMFAVFFLPVLPLYLSMMSASDGSSTSLGIRTFTEMRSSLVFFFENPAFWMWGVVGALALVGLAISVRDAKSRGAAFVVLSMLAVSGLAFLGPGVWGVRSLYYAYLPIWVFAALGAVYLLGRIGSVVPDWSVQFKRFALPEPVLALAAALGLALVIWTGSGYYDRLGRAIAFYRLVDTGQIEASTYLGSLVSPDSTVIAHPFFAGWWLEGGIGVNAYEISRFTARLQNEQALIAESILMGNHVITNGIVSAGDSFPDTAEGTPQIWVTLPGGQRAGEKSAFTYFDDGATIVSLFDEDGTLREIPLQSMEREIAVLPSEQRIEIAKRFRIGDTAITQTTTIIEDQAAWQVRYDFDQGSRVVAVKIPVYYLGMTAFEKNGDGRNFSAKQSIKGRQLVTNVALSGGNAMIESLPRNLPTLEQPFSLGETWINAVPDADDFSVVLDFQVAVEATSGAAMSLTSVTETPPGNYLHYSNAHALIEEHGIDFAYLSDLPGFVTRRLEHSPGYEPLWLQSNLYVYKIHPERFSDARSAEAIPINFDAAGQLASDELQQIARWSGLRSTGIRKAFPEGLSGYSVIAANVSVQPGKWSGLVFTPAFPFQADENESISAVLNWENVGRVQTYSFALEDSNGRRWAWYRAPSQVSEVEGGWHIWELHRGEANRQDEGFDWDSVLRIHLSVLAPVDGGTKDATISVGSISGLGMNNAF